VQKNIRTAQMFIFAIIFTLAIVGAASAADNSSGNLTATSVDQASQTHDNSQTVTNSSILNPLTIRQKLIIINQSNLQIKIQPHQILKFIMEEFLYLEEYIQQGIALQIYRMQ